MESKRLHTVIGIWTNICRILLAIVFIFSGFVKANDPLGMQYKIQDYLQAFGVISWVPVSFPLLATAALALLEFGMGCYLLMGIRKRFTSLVVLVMMLVMTPFTLYLAIVNPVSDCGCFGDALILTNWETFWKNIILLIAAYSVFRWHDRVLRLIRPKSEWLTSLYIFIFCIVVFAYCLRHLPIFDFRPYHIGANIPQEMVIPKGAKPTVYDTKFILEKNGVRKEFSLDNYPDSTWTFVDSRSIVKEKGYEPPIKDFSVEKVDDGQDLTDEILNSDNYIFLLVAYNLKETDDSEMDLINELYDYCQDHGYGFYALTSSLEGDIAAWRDRAGAEYPFGQMDEIALKTIVRSNPGLILLKKGVVINKWSNHDIPDEYQLTDKLENLSIGHLDKAKIPHKILTVLLSFILPLILLIILDGIFAFSTYLRKKEDLFLNPLKHKKMRKKIVAGNWKMNKNLQEGIALAKELNEVLTADKPNCGVIICTPFIHLASVTPVVDETIIGVGAENCADKVSGAYTGEVSAEMVASTGAQYVILGHSERRAYYHETIDILTEKVKLALANGLKIIFCIGEVLEEREANKQNEVVKAQLASVFGLSKEEFANIILAYEPVWAIGTGKTATPQQAEEIHAYIRFLVADTYGDTVADDTTILYGGSCKPSNAKELFANPDVDGGLIGGAALKVADFKGIIDAFK